MCKRSRNNEKPIDVACLQKTLLRMVILSPTRVTATALFNKYRDEKGKSVPYRKLGFRSFMDMIKAALPGTFMIEENPRDKKDPILTPIVPEKWTTWNNFALNAVLRPAEAALGRRSYVLKRDYDAVKVRDVHEKLIKKINDALIEYPNGIDSAEFYQIYREKHGSRIPYQRMGYSSIIGLMYQLPTVVRVIATGPGVWKLLSVQFPPPDREVTYRLPLKRLKVSPMKEVDPEDALPGLPYEPGVYPEDCTRPGDEIGKVSISNLQVGQQMEVALAEIYSPSHMWLHQLNNSNYTAYHKMAREMSQYYKQEGYARHLSRAATQVGHYCCVIIEDIGLRAVIIQLVDCSTVKVRLVDYGLVKKVNTDTLRVLLKKWTDVPAIALRARLAYVKPKAGHSVWSVESTLALKSLVQDGSVSAEIVRKDSAAEEFWVKLWAGEVCINTKLVADNMALREPCFMSHLRYYEFPLFRAIEEGRTLSFEDIERMKELNIDISHLKIYMNFFPPFVDVVPVNDEPEHLPGPPAFSGNEATQPPPPPTAAAALALHGGAASNGEVVLQYEDIIHFNRLGINDPKAALEFIIEKILCMKEEESA